MAIFSREKEKVVLEREVTCVGGVENWLNSLLKMHQQSVGSVISQGLQLLNNPDTEILQLIDNSVLQVRVTVVIRHGYKNVATIRRSVCWPFKYHGRGMPSSL